MPSKFRLRKIFAPIVKLIAQGFVKLKITPNQATWIMLVCASISIVFLIGLKSLLGLGIWLFITGIMDGVDGAIARSTNQKSAFGGFFDSTMDRISEALIYTAIFLMGSQFFLFSPPIIFLLVGFAFIFSNLTSYVRARLDLEGKDNQIVFDTNIGFLGRSERLFFLFIISLLGYFLGFAVFSWGFVAFAISTTGTFVYRFFKYKGYLENLTSQTPNQSSDKK